MAINRGRLHLLNDLEVTGTPNDSDTLSFDLLSGKWKPTSLVISPAIFESVDIVSSNSTVVSTNQYAVGKNVLMVFLNGTLQRTGVNHDYVEVDSNTVRFNFPLVIGDVVTFRIESSGIVTTPSSGGGITTTNANGSFLLNF